MINGTLLLRGKNNVRA